MRQCFDWCTTLARGSRSRLSIPIDDQIPVSEPSRHRHLFRSPLPKGRHRQPKRARRGAATSGSSRNLLEDFSRLATRQIPRRTERALRRPGGRLRDGSLARVCRTPGFPSVPRHTALGLGPAFFEAARPYFDLRPKQAVRLYRRDRPKGGCFRRAVGRSWRRAQRPNGTSQPACFWEVIPASSSETSR